MASTALPSAPSGVEVLALLMRARSVRVAQGELAAERLYDVRAFKTVWAELAYCAACRPPAGMAGRW